MKTTFALFTLGLSISALASTQSPWVIYGQDNRHDLYSYANPKVVTLAKSTVALVKGSDLRKSNALSTLLAESYEESMGLCSTERFKDQPAGAFCSGFLIAPNKIITAGHCIESISDCAETKFVFDYAMKDASTARLAFTDSQVYSCKKILGRKLENKGLDFAVIELDRSVVGRTPLKLSKNTTLKANSKIFVIGHPSGLPTKITDSAKVRSVNSAEGFFVANLDTYGGNSGSAVFNEATHEVEGILVRGEKDFDDAGSCQISFQVGEDEGRGEDVTLIGQVVENGHTEEENSSSSEIRYVYIDSDGSCNEFHGSEYIREVSMSLCTDAPEIRYVWLDSDMSCNEFRGSNYIREVSDYYCDR